VSERDSDDLNKENERNKETSNWVVYLTQTEKFSNNAKARKTSDQVICEMNKEEFNWVVYLTQIKKFSDDVKSREILDQVVHMTKGFSDDVKAKETSDQVVRIVSIEDGKNGNDQTSQFV
ncbi:6875_t:CDS:2, partial [Acaulospora morrowiae]